MIRIGSPHEMQNWAFEQKAKGLSIGFVPTMGALHRGHLALVNKALSENDAVVVSVFVNPTQFDNPEDLRLYPMDLEKDCELLSEQGVDVVFHPQAQQMYPQGDDIFVNELGLSKLLCGAFRPGHFQGMLTIVLKLLLVVQPQRTYFGEKDFQQLLLVEKLVENFFLPVEVRRVKTVRDDNGIALSSRNQRLPESELKTLTLFPKILRDSNSDESAAAALQQAGFKVDYVSTYAGFRHGAIEYRGVRFIDHVEM